MRTEKHDPYIKGASFKHEIHLSISGKKGETKTISAGASTDGRLLLFRNHVLDAKDGTEQQAENGSVLSRNEGTYVMDLKFGLDNLDDGFKFRAWPSSAFSVAGRSGQPGLLHPRHKASVTVHFVEDCTWVGRLIGTAVEVENAGAYAIVPTVPCDRTFDFSDTIKIQTEKTDHIVDSSVFGKALAARIVKRTFYPGASRALAANDRCEHCWFQSRKHTKWPWREWSQSIETDLLAPEQETSVVVEPGRLFVSDRVGFADDREGWSIPNRFVTDGFSIVGNESEKTTPGHFVYYANIVVPEQHKLRFHVRNKTKEKIAFKGKIVGQEMFA